MIHIKFTDGGNPYVLANESLLCKWFYNYDVRIIKIADGAIFFVSATETTKRKTYQQAKEAARQFAIDTQNKISENAFSYDEIERVTTVLKILWKRFGLLREFKENGIC